MKSAGTAKGDMEAGPPYLQPTMAAHKWLKIRMPSLRHFVKGNIFEEKEMQSLSKPHFRRKSQWEGGFCSWPDLHVFVLSWFLPPDVIADLKKAGPRGFEAKSSDTNINDWV